MWQHAYQFFHLMFVESCKEIYQVLSPLLNNKISIYVYLWNTQTKKGYLFVELFHFLKIVIAFESLKLINIVYIYNQREQESK